MRPSHQVYRGDIQGLRALAVILVVLDHAHVGPLQGGFVGVDVFFAISGFLITSLLVAEARRDGRISLLGFYSRRARRILPAASLVILTTILASVIVLGGIEAQRTVRDALWTTFFLANAKFTKDGTDYFQADTAPSPLQHYWSLAVEEQFYLVWPLLLILLILVARRVLVGRGRPGHRAVDVTRAAVPVLVLIVLASFAWSIDETKSAAVPAYFSPFTRAWELGLGALVACLAHRLVRTGGHVLAGASWLGLAAVAYAALAYDSTTPFPGSAAAVPVVGASLLLAGGLGSARWGPQLLLSLPPMRHVGDWSYSVYLWHWPALVIAAALWRTPAGWYGLLVLAGVVALSALTYTYVENPVRRAGPLARPAARGLLLYPAVVLVTLPLLFGADHWIRHQTGGGGPSITLRHFGQHPGDANPSFNRDRAAALVEASVLAAHNGLQVPRHLDPPLLQLDQGKSDLSDCSYTGDDEKWSLCPRGDSTGDRTLVLMGDSHARQWVPALEPIAAANGMRAYFLVRPGCPGVDATPWRSDGSGPNVECENFQDWAFQQVVQLQPDVAILAADANPAGFADVHGHRVSDEAGVAALFQAAMAREIDRLGPSTRRVVVIGDPPDTDELGSDCLAHLGGSLETCITHPDPRGQASIEALHQAALQRQVQYVSTARWFCVGDECPAVVGHFLTRFDHTHVTGPYAGHLSGALGQELRLWVH